MITKIIPHESISITLRDIDGYKGSFFSNIIYRIKNIFKAIIGKSDWDISHKKLTDLLVEPGISNKDIYSIKIAVSQIMNDYLMGASGKHHYKFILSSGFDSIKFTN